MNAQASSTLPQRLRTAARYVRRELEDAKRAEALWTNGPAAGTAFSLERSPFA